MSAQSLSTAALIASGGTASFCVGVVLVLTKRLHGRVTLDSVAGVHKFHSKPTPRIGGVAIFAGLIVSWYLLRLAAPTQGALHGGELAALLGPLLVAGIPAFAFGLLEDLTKRVGVLPRLLATMVSGFLAWWLTGVSIDHVDVWGFDSLLALQPLAALFTAFAVGGVANAFNIIDGFNGLACGSIIISLSAIGFIAAAAGDPALAALCVVLVAVVLGFGVVNFPLGKIFLGDGGAYLLGFLVSWSAVLLTMRNRAVSPWAGLLACGYPVLEVGFSVWRKYWRADCHPGQPDKVHLHMLFYRRVSRLFFRRASPTVQNSLSSPFGWLAAAVPALIAVAFYKNTTVLVAGYAACAVLYRLVYMRLTQFRWCLPFVPPKSRFPALSGVSQRTVSIGGARARSFEMLDLLGLPTSGTQVGDSFHTSCVDGKSVLVIGAGSPLGAALCREIAKLRPKDLVLIEPSDVALAMIERELRSLVDASGYATEIFPVMGDAYQKQRLRDVMRTYRVQTVVCATVNTQTPLVEQNVVHGAYHNVVATFQAAEAAAEASAEIFVLLSSNEALRPKSVMGVTSRVAELVVQGMQQRDFATRFCSVRVGEVLDYPTSVTSEFRLQIERGGPVVVSNARVPRYFMTTTEVAKLSICAGSMTQGGEIFVLEPREPLRLEELARRAVKLMGFTVRDEANPQGEIAIEYAGLQPGERALDELLYGDSITATESPLIKRTREYALPWKHVRRFLDDLLTACKAFDTRRTVWLLSEAVPEYRPPVALGDLLATRRLKLGLEFDNVTELPQRRRANDPATGNATAPTADRPSTPTADRPSTPTLDRPSTQ